MSDTVLMGVLVAIYREMYRRATPPADIDKLIKRGVTKKRGWFNAYYLDQDTQIKIIDKHCRRHKLDKHDTKNVHIKVMLGAAPTCLMSNTAKPKKRR